MISTNHRKSRTEIKASPSSPQELPFESPWQPPTSITIPILIGNVEESLNRASPSPLKTNKKHIPKNFPPIDEITFHNGKFKDTVVIGAGPIDNSSIYSENFTEMLNKADRITKDADTMLKLLEMTIDDIDSSLTSALDSYPQEVHTRLRESLHNEGLTCFSGDDSSVSSGDIQSPAFELLERLYGRDSFRLTQDRGSRRKKYPSYDAPVSAIADDRLVSNRQLTDQSATESRSLDELDPIYIEDCSQKKSNSSSRENHVKNESRDVQGAHEIAHGSPLHHRQWNTQCDSICQADNRCRQAVGNEPPRFRDLVIRSRTCDMGFDSSAIYDFSPRTQRPRNVELRRSAKVNSSTFKRTCSEGMVNNPKVVPKPPPRVNANSTPLPLLNNHSSDNNSIADRNSDVGVHCLTGSYDDMMSLAQRMSSNRSLGDPSILENPIEKQYRKKLRGRPKSKTQMRGRGRSAEKSKTIRYTNDSCGELSGAETSQTSRKSTNSRLVASRLRKLEHEKRKKQRAQEKTQTLNGRSRSLDRLYSCGSNQQCKGNVAAQSATIKKSGIAGLLQSKMDRLAFCLGRSATGSKDIISGTLSTADSRSTRCSSQSWDRRKSLQSRASKKPNNALLSPKMRIMRRGSILSATADIFPHQCIQVNVSDAMKFDVESSCNSSLSC